MPVPAKRQSSSRKGGRRSHHALGKKRLGRTASGAVTLPHRVASDGTYKGRQIIKPRVKKKKTS